LGNNSYSINGGPAGIEKFNPATLLKNIVNQTIETDCHVRESICEAIALSLAKSIAIPSGKKLSVDEMNSLIASLFSSTSYSYTPDGRLVLSVFSDEELDKRFK
jgi:DNA mismatch repair protein MutL